MKVEFDDITKIMQQLCSSCVGGECRYCKVDKFYEDIQKLPQTEEDRWFPIDEAKPEPHEDVLVRGIEMISGREVTAVKQYDVDTFRPVSAPSVVWKEWHKISK